MFRMTLRCAFPVLLLFASSSQADWATIIRRVENGLSPRNRVANETWNIEDRMKHYGVPGVSIAVISNNRVVWTKSYGVMDAITDEPTTVDTLFQAASISKPVSAFAALRMVEEGVFDLDADINKYLKSWKLPQNKYTEKQNVTLKHLISHTGGVTVHGFRGYRHSEKLPTLLQLLDGKEPANSGAIRVNKTPGGKFRYSGGGYCIMQQMMEDQSGLPYAQLIRKYALSPLNMRLSTFAQPLPTDRMPEAAAGHARDANIVPGKHHVYPEIAPAGLWTTSRELAGFLIHVHDAYHGRNTSLLSQEMAQQFVDEKLGILSKEIGGEVYFGHSGWNEGFSSDALIHQKTGNGLVVLTNANQPDFIEEVFNSVASNYEWPKFVKEFHRVKIEQKELKKIVGRYGAEENLVKVESKDDRILLVRHGRSPEEIVHIGDRRFVQLNNQPELVVFFEKPSSTLKARKNWHIGFQRADEKAAPTRRFLREQREKQNAESLRTDSSPPLRELNRNVELSVSQNQHADA